MGQGRCLLEVQTGRLWHTIMNDCRRYIPTIWTGSKFYSLKIRDFFGKRDLIYSLIVI